MHHLQPFKKKQKQAVVTIKWAPSLQCSGQGLAHSTYSLMKVSFFGGGIINPMWQPFSEGRSLQSRDVLYVGDRGHVLNPGLSGSKSWAFLLFLGRIGAALGEVHSSSCLSHVFLDHAPL